MVAAFHIVRIAGTDKPAAAAADLEQAFARQGFGPGIREDGRTWRMVVYPRSREEPPVRYDGPSGQRAFAAGTLFYGNRFGAEALAVLDEDYRAARVAWDELHGSFAVIIANPDEVAVFTDRPGTFHLFRDEAGTVVSSSFLAMAESLPRLTIDPRGVYEYVLHEAPHGGSTVFKEISVFDPTAVLHLGRTVREAAMPPLAAGEAERHGSLDDQAARCLEPLRAQVRAYVAAFGDRIDTALSGGFDSRLLLALLREQRIRPRLHVYGREADADVQVANRIAAGEGLALQHIEKSQAQPLEVEAFAEQVARNLVAFDGYPNDGLFNNGLDLATRRQRCAKGELMLNGGGGEVFRNFFYLPDRPMSARALAQAFYSQYAPAVCRGAFDEARHAAVLALKISCAVGAETTRRLARRQIEAAYPLFRCRYWMGRNNSVNNRLGFAVTPYCTARTVAVSLSVPLADKNSGRLQARMIAMVDPRLAAYPSAYGFDFDAGPPRLYRLKDAVNRWRPLLLRRYSYRLRHRRPATWPWYLSDAHLEHLIGRGFEHVGRFLDPQRATDVAQYNRICTLEYLFRHVEQRLS